MLQDDTNWDSASQIDPLILKLIQKNSRAPESEKTDSVEFKKKPRKLGTLYAIFIGISAMLLVMLLGIVRCTDVEVILVGAVRTLPVFCVLGFIAGTIAELCIRESAKSMLRLMLQRADAMPGDGESNEAPKRE